MGMRFSGSCDGDEGMLLIYGDGQSNTIAIDLTTSPFDLSFGKGGPTGVVLLEDVNDPNVTPSIDPSGVLTLTFDTPPPAADFSRHPPGSRQIWFRLVYG